jgi:hypothetical protein
MRLSSWCVIIAAVVLFTAFFLVPAGGEEIVPVAWYPFDGNALDKSGHNHHAPIFAGL